MPDAPLNPILLRQLRRLSLAVDAPPKGLDGWHALLRRISRTYDDHRQSQYLMERSLHMVSKEMQELYARIERAAHERLRQFFDLSLDLFCVAGLDGYLKIVNPAWEGLLGYDPAQLTAVPFLDFVHPDDREATLAGMARLGEGSPLVSFENRFRQRDGSWVPLRWNVIPDVANGLIYASGRDIGWEAEARVLSERIVDAAPNGMVLVDHTGTITLANAEAERLFGYEAGTLVGMPVERLMALDRRALHRTLRETWQTDQRTRPMGSGRDLVGVTKQGDEIHVEIALNPLNIGGRQFVLAALADIGSRKEFEEQLRQARDAALALAQAKADFLANMSHEIRTPLNAVIGLSGLLLETELDDRQREYAGIVRHAGDTLLAIINDILDFSKIEAGKLALESLDFSPRAIVDEAIQMVASAAASKGLAMHLRADISVPAVVRGDPGRIRQVLLNLLSNAVKFTARGAVDVSVSYAGGVLTCHVIDSGIGIAADILPRLFSPFTQADSSMARRFGGTGLGLTICQRLVALMDGTLGVESIPGQGSDFRFAIPLPPGPDQPNERGDAGQRGPTRKAAGRVNLSGAKHRILLVEDNPINQKVGLTMLRNLHYEADAVANGIEALQMLERVPYDLVLMDCQMPEMDGFAATREWRRLEPGDRRLPVIALTASALPEDRQRCLDAGMDDHIAKPITVDQLARALAKFLRT